MRQIELENTNPMGLNKRYNYIEMSELSFSKILRLVLALLTFALTAYSYLIAGEYFEYLFTASSILILIGFVKVLGNTKTENT